MVTKGVRVATIILFWMAFLAGISTTSGSPVVPLIALLSIVIFVGMVFVSDLLLLVRKTKKTEQGS